MSRQDEKGLTPFSYAVLALVGGGGAGPHDLVQMMRRGVLYWTAAESHYYSEPKRLAKLGYLTARKEPGQTRERTHYMLTPQGRVALREWLARPAGLPRIQNEAIVKLLAADLTDDDAVVLASLAGLRDEMLQARADLEVSETVASTLHGRERYLRLIHSLGRALADTHLEWLDEVERELGQAERDPPHE